MANVLTQDGRDREDRDRRTEFIVPAGRMWRRSSIEIGMRLKKGQDGRPNPMQASKHLSEAMKRRGGNGERKMPEDALNRFRMGTDFILEGGGYWRRSCLNEQFWTA